MMWYHKEILCSLWYTKCKRWPKWLKYVFLSFESFSTCNPLNGHNVRNAFWSFLSLDKFACCFNLVLFITYQTNTQNSTILKINQTNCYDKLNRLRLIEPFFVLVWRFAWFACVAPTVFIDKFWFGEEHILWIGPKIGCKAGILADAQFLTVCNLCIGVASRWQVVDAHGFKIHVLPVSWARPPAEFGTELCMLMACPHEVACEWPTLQIKDAFSGVFKDGSHPCRLKIMKNWAPDDFTDVSQMPLRCLSDASQMKYFQF